MSERSLHVIFGTGPLGKSVMRAALARGYAVRMVNRSGEADVPAGVEVVAADLYQPDDVRRVASGAAVTYQCAQPEYSAWAEKFPPLQAAIIDGVAGSGARMVVGDNLYMIDNTHGAPIHEGLAHNYTTKKGKMRAEMADRVLEAHRTGALSTALVRASDFYGPEVLGSAVGERTFPPLLTGKPVQVIGDPDVAHTVTYIDDFGMAMVMVGERESALGQSWHVPTAGVTTMRDFLTLAASVAGTELKVSRVQPWMLRMLGIFVPNVREIAEMLYQFNTPYVVDHSKFVREFGDIATSYAAGLRATIDWYRAHSTAQKAA
ncbi:MAG: NAD(P)H-binding protein [Chloroflexi bacterium]|nr:NAD(P)H-binding protein [Chloroflexota bacterium]